MWIRNFKDAEELGHLFACTFLFYFAVCIAIPSITDITLEALCPGNDQCPLAIYLTGVTQAVTGLGTFFVTPIVGNLSDKYGRKRMLTLPMTMAIIPPVVLIFGRTRTFFYTYYFIKMLTSMFCEGSMQCLTLAYVADKTCEGRRISTFGVLSGIVAAGFVSAILTARFLPTSFTFPVSAAVAVLAVVYMIFFLAESGASLADESFGPLLPPTQPSEGEQSAKLPSIGKVPSLANMVTLFRSSLTLSRAAIIVFVDSFGSSGIQASMNYFLKAQFQFSKDQYAILMLIAGLAGTFSQLVVMPFLAPSIGEKILLSVGLLASCANVFLVSFAWAFWVPYFSSSFVVLSILGQPCLRTIVSKTVGPNDQGLVQGGITGLSSIASIASPMLFSPLTALFLSEKAPFEFKGFSLICGGFTLLLAFALSFTMHYEG